MEEETLIQLSIRTGIVNQQISSLRGSNANLQKNANETYPSLKDGRLTVTALFSC